jgi:cytoskeletal protein CcmA (bactofilin family)
MLGKIKREGINIMLGNNNSEDMNIENKTKPVDTVDTLLGENSSFNGDIEFSGGLRIDGIVRGNVTTLDATNGLLVVSETGEVEGDITVPHVIINGAVCGNVISSEHLELQGNAQVTGDVQYQGVEMQLGASLNGNLVSNPKSAVRAAPSTKKENSNILTGSSEACTSSEPFGQIGL